MDNNINFKELIQPGFVREETFTVEDQHTAIQVGSGGTRVLATPWMIAFMERVSHRLLAEHLLTGYSSVGVRVDVRHLAPSPVGFQVRVRSEVLSLDGLRVTHKVEAWDEKEKLGEGLHERIIIDEERFLNRVRLKREGKPVQAPPRLEEAD